MHVQSCCFTNMNLLLFRRSRCRCHCCLSSLLLSSKNWATIVTCRHTSPLYCEQIVQINEHKGEPVLFALNTIYLPLSLSWSSTIQLFRSFSIFLIFPPPPPPHFYCPPPRTTTLRGMGTRFRCKPSGIVWEDKRYLWLVDGWLKYHRSIITNACPPQKSLHPKLVPILPKVSEMVNCFSFLGLQPRDKAAMLGVKTIELFLEEFTWK